MSKTSKEDDVLANIFVCDKQDGAKGKAVSDIKKLIQEAKIEELKFIDDFLSEEYQHEFDTKKYCQSRIADLREELKGD